MIEYYRIKATVPDDGISYYYCGWDNYKRAHVFNKHIQYSKKYTDVKEATQMKNILKNIFQTSVTSITVVKISEKDAK